MAAELKHSVHEVLKIWNENVKNQKTNIEYVIDIYNRKKKYYTNRDKFYTLDIAELRFISKGDENLLLWRKELQIPDKVPGVSKDSIRRNYEDQLYKYFLHEAIGTFGMTAASLITNKDYAEYDVEKDRIKPDEYFKDHIVEATENGVFYEKGDKFDVFTELEGGWAVYTAHEAGNANNGIAKLDKSVSKVIQETAQKIELIEPKGSKLILPKHLQK